MGRVEDQQTGHSHRRLDHLACRIEELRPHGPNRLRQSLLEQQVVSLAERIVEEPPLHRTVQ